MGKYITNPTSFSVGDDITATILNQYRSAVIALDSRWGARVTTTNTQAISATTLTTLNNGGTNAWTATEDTGSFVSAVGGTTTPITIPSGSAGLYRVGGRLILSAASSGRLYLQPVINGTGNSDHIGIYADTQCSGDVPIALNAGDTIGMQAFTATATNIAVGCQIWCYRLNS